MMDVYDGRILWTDMMDVHDGRIIMLDVYDGRI